MIMKKKKNKIGFKFLKKSDLYFMITIKKFIKSIITGNKDLSSWTFLTLKFVNNFILAIFEPTELIRST